MTTDTNDQQLEYRLEEMIAESGEVDFQDVEIKIFQTQLDNVVFGLVVDEESGIINLQPSLTFSFQEPWNGEYYTLQTSFLACIQNHVRHGV